VLHDEASYQLLLQGEADLAGLPAFVRAAARQAASERGLADGHVITLSRSLVVPFLTFSSGATCASRPGAPGSAAANMPASTTTGRWRAPSSSCATSRRAARPRLLCRLRAHRHHGRHAHAVQQLLDEVWPRALAAVEREREELLQVMRERPGGGSTARGLGLALLGREGAPARYALDDAEIKPYFPLAAWCRPPSTAPGGLFGLRFVHRPDLPVYHPDVKAYEVRDADGRGGACSCRTTSRAPASAAAPG
jgi:peptidyl-dipeptidase Dcp